MFEFVEKIRDRYRQNKVEKLLNVQKSLSEVNDSIDILEKSDSEYISVLAQLKLNKNKLLKSEKLLQSEDPKFNEMLNHMQFEHTYKEVLNGYRSNQIGIEKCDEILKSINEDKKVRYSDNLVFNHEGKLLLLKRSELDKTFPGMYTIPGGHVDAGEDHRTAAIRELQEESGLTPDKDSQFQKVGEYEDDKVCIEYFLSYVDNDNNTLCLQSEEAWQYEWIDSKELDKYEFPLNMKQNIQKILYPNKEVIVKLGKAYKSGKVTREKFLEAVDVLTKSVAVVGETRHWSDGDYKKVANGEWVKVVGEKEKKVAGSGIIKKIKVEQDILGQKFTEEKNKFESSLDSKFAKHTIQYKVFFERSWYEEFEKNPILQKIREDQKNLNKEIIEIQQQLELNKKRGREEKIGKKEIDEKDIIPTLRSLDKLFQDVKSKIPQTLPADQVAPIVTVDSYYIDTKADFELVESYSPIEIEGKWKDNVQEKWDEMKNSGKYEYTHSPKSNSEYLIDRETGDIYRMADHWGRCASCYWVNLWEGDYGIGVCNAKHFERKNTGSWFNPEYRDKIVEASEISLNELKSLANKNDIYFTDKAKEHISKFVEDIFYSKLKHSALLNEEQLNEFKEKYKDLFEERYLKQDKETQKSLQSINELYLQNRISDELYETIIEKAWQKSPIGTITTRSNGQKYKKVSETGNKDQDWQLVGKPKTGSKTDEPVSKKGSSKEGITGEPKDISEHAKQSSETALNTAIKESPDPEVRQAAHEELDRRSKEEAVQEEEKKVGGEKKEEKTDIEKFKESVNKEFKKVTEDLSNFEDWSDNKKLHDLSTRQKYISTFLQKVNNVSSEKLEEKQNKLKKYLNFDGDLKTVFGDGKILALEVQGDPKKVFSALCVMEDGFTARMFKPDSKEIMMHEFYLNPSIKTGKGKGTEIFSNQVEQFKKLGYEKLTTDAEKSDIFNGYYTWAIEGYQMSKDEEREDFNNLVRTLKDEKLNKVKSLEELVSTKEGREYWRKEGFKFTGEFDMRDNSKSMTTLNNYKNERSSRNNK